MALSEKHAECAQCGMVCAPNEYHPYAACLMFAACKDGAVVRANLAEVRKDVDRLDWLESQINTNGAIHLHDGHHPSGTGLGLRPGHAVRTLREAIDAAMPGDTNGLNT